MEPEVVQGVVMAIVLIFLRVGVLSCEIKGMIVGMAGRFYAVRFNLG